MSLRRCWIAAYPLGDPLVPALANPLVQEELGMASEVGCVHQKLVQLAASEAAGLSRNTELSSIDECRI